MTRKNFYYGALVLGAVATLTLAGTLTLLISRSHRKPSPAADAPIVAQATTSTATESKGGQKELIKVHGHWTIDVRNTDGTLVTHREFENGLTSDGKQVLAEVLSRHTKFGFWRIVLGSSPSKAGLSPWSNGSTGQIVEPNDPLPLAPNVSKNLYLCLGSSQGSIGIGNLCTGVQQPAATFLLGGNIKADSSGTISGVGTTYSGCDYPATCPNPNQVGFDSFTTHQLAPLVNGSCPPNTQCEVDVVAGQIIQVTVLISFS